MGVPVIGTRTGSIPDVVEHGVNGYLVERSATSVAEALDLLSEADRPSLRQAARRTAEQHTWGHVAARYVELLDGLRDAPGRGREAS
jgi:UDP-glucose:(heptosyl)LPS alpha-1,3-glucosyltransferase